MAFCKVNSGPGWTGNFNAVEMCFQCRSCIPSCRMACMSGKYGLKPPTFNSTTLNVVYALDQGVHHCHQIHQMFCGNYGWESNGLQNSLFKNLNFNSIFMQTWKQFRTTSKICQRNNRNNFFYLLFIFFVSNICIYI